MLDTLRTLLARLIVRWLPGPRSLLIGAWAWLAAGADDLQEKRRCLEQVWALGPAWARQALDWLEAQEAAASVDPANAAELETIAEEVGADVLKGALRYPSGSGSWQLGDVDLGEHLARFRGQEVTVIIAATGKAEEPPTICGICGFVLDEARECPRCKLINAAIIASWRRRQEEREEMWREVQKILSADSQALS